MDGRTGSGYTNAPCLKKYVFNMCKIVLQFLLLSSLYFKIPKHSPHKKREAGLSVKLRCGGEGWRRSARALHFASIEYPVVVTKICISSFLRNVCASLI